ncbi:MAG: hypothetical protein WCT04_23505 [Planctomycetota bacterium]
MHRNALLLSAMIAVCISASVTALESKPVSLTPQKATALQLVTDAKRAIALIGKTVKECSDNSLDLKSIRQQPFWSALKRTDDVIKVIEAKLKTHDLAFFEAITISTQCAAELRGALPRAGIKNSQIESSVKVISNVLTLLRKNYGVEALRKKQGGPLSEKEQAEFTKLKEAEKTLVAQFEALLVDVKGNAHLTAELNRLIAQLKKNIDAPMTVDAMNAAQELADVIDGEWDSYSYFVEPQFRKAWQNPRIAESLSAIEAINRDGLMDLVAPDWSYLDESVEFPASVDVSVEIEVAEVDGYFTFVATSIKGVEVEMYYEEVPADDWHFTEFEELPNE